MNTNTLKLTLAAGSAALLFGLAGACGDEVLGTDCITDADCLDPINPTCHPFTGECGTLGCTEATAASDCGGQTPVCNIAVNGVRPAPAANNDICVCDATSCAGNTVCSNVGGTCVLGCADTSSTTDPTVKIQCGAGETCNTTTGACEEMVNACTMPGSMGADPCLNTEVCLPDGTCSQPCNSVTDCVATEELCEIDPTNANEFNTCVAPGQVTEQCANYTMATGVGRDAGGPLIVSVAYDTDAAAAASCTGNATPRYFNAVIADDGTFDMSLYTMRLRFLQEDGNETNTFSEGPGTEWHPTIMAGSAAGTFDLRFSLCLSDVQMMSSLAIYVTNDAGEESNGFCFSGL